MAQATEARPATEPTVISMPPMMMTTIWVIDRMPMMATDWPIMLRLLGRKKFGLAMPNTATNTMMLMMRIMFIAPIFSFRRLMKDRFGLVG